MIYTSTDLLRLRSPVNPPRNEQNQGGAHAPGKQVANAGADRGRPRDDRDGADGALQLEHRERVEARLLTGVHRSTHIPRNTKNGKPRITLIARIIRSSFPFRVFCVFRGLILSADAAPAW